MTPRYTGVAVGYVHTIPADVELFAAFTIPQVEEVDLRLCLGRPGMGCGVVPVAYPGAFSGCPEPPPAMIFFNEGGDTVTGTDLHQPLTFATFGNPP